MRIAIQADDYTDPRTGKADASSPRWTSLLESRGHEVRPVDVTRFDILTQVEGCDGFMWRHGHMATHRQVAKRLLPVLEHELGLVVYPDQATCWHYDDKIAQFYLLKALKIPVPETWIWFDREQASKWLGTATFPLVIKLWTGASSENVRLVRCHSEAQVWIERLFKTGVGRFSEVCLIPSPPLSRRLRDSAKILLKGRYPARPPELHKNYVLFQEFLPDNAFDTRIWVIGKRAFGFRRFNRPGDFRASGSGRIDYDPRAIDVRAVHLAFAVASKLRASSINMDILKRQDELVVSEVSYTGASWAVDACPGHWERKDNELEWVEAPMWPEQAQIEDFLLRLEARQHGKG